jgi:hypothetical protein
MVINTLSAVSKIYRTCFESSIWPTNNRRVFLEALPEILDYANIALTSSDYVEPPLMTNKNIQYKQLFDALKSISI